MKKVLSFQLEMTSAATGGGSSVPGNDVSAVTSDSTLLVEAVEEEENDVINNTVFPSINSRLANLRPSKDLLDYYR